MNNSTSTSYRSSCFLVCFLFPNAPLQFSIFCVPKFRLQGGSTCRGGNTCGWCFDEYHLLMRSPEHGSDCCKLIEACFKAKSPPLAYANMRWHTTGRECKRGGLIEFGLCSLYTRLALWFVEGLSCFRQWVVKREWGIFRLSCLVAKSLMMEGILKRDLHTCDKPETTLSSLKWVKLIPRKCIHTMKCMVGTVTMCYNNVRGDSGMSR